MGQEALFSEGLYFLPQRSFAEPSFGDVDRSGKREVVGAGKDDAEQGEDIFDLAPLVKGEAADNAIGDAVCGGARPQKRGIGSGSDRRSRTRIGG